MRKITLLLFPFLLATAQHHMPTGPEKPVTLIPGLGNWRHTISTTNPQAQRYFDQGLALLYGFNRYEAQRSFRKASELDSKAAMPYWGIAMSLGPYVNMDGDPTFDQKASCAAIESGLKITSAPERERAYVQAAAKRCPEYQPQLYIDAMKALAASYPDDLDAATMYAESLMVPIRWHWYAMDGTPGAGMPEAERVLESVLRRWPDHPGANHFYIHAVESSPTPERAIPSAQRLMGVVPEAGHMVHMPGHIWLITGDWEMAASVNERAAEVDRKYFAATNVSSGSYPMYYVHNLHFIAYARWMQGRKADGLRAAGDMASAVTPLTSTMPEIADAFTAIALFGRVRFGDWEAILKLPKPDAKMVASGMIWQYSRVLALAARKDAAGAAKERAAFDAIRAKIPAEAPWGINNKAADVMAVASEVLAARTAASENEAVPHWQRAVSLQDALVYDEPPAWYYPVRESLGASLLRAGRSAEAEKVFREGIAKSPRNGRMLFGLAESLKAQGKKDDEQSVRREYEAAWSRADVKLSLNEL